MSTYPAPTTLLGWCQTAPGTKEDAYHKLCPGHITTQFDVVLACSCPKHREEVSE